MNTEDDVAYYQKLCEEVGDISEELLPFFYLKEDKKCFMTHFYFDRYMLQSFTDYNLSAIQNALEDHEQVVEQMIRFFFPDIPEEKVGDCKSSFVEISRFIHKSAYSAEVKNGLSAFFLYPEKMVQKLSCELSMKKQFLCQKYEKSVETIQELYGQFEMERVASALANQKKKSVNLVCWNDIYVSFCLCVKDCVKLYTDDHMPLLLLGRNYGELLKQSSQNQYPALDALGNILAEANRIELLDLISRKKEVTIREIEQTLGLAGTNAYYHLSLMLRIGMLRVRNRGRTLLYSINQEYFMAAGEALQQYGR